MNRTLISGRIFSYKMAADHAPMAKRSLLPARVDAYVGAHTREGGLARRLRRETSRLAMARMQIGPDQAAFLSWLVRAMGVRHAVEVGTFTGMSALAVASALPGDGRLVCCDVSEEWTSIGRRYWEEAGVAGRIDLRLGPAADTLASLLREHGEGSFDFAFIDADKRGYDGYYEACLRLLRPGGAIALDNMLWSGKVADPAKTDRDTKAIRKLNRKVLRDPRVEASLLTVGDGVLLALKR
jgi:predicted O-methyltransferase YrrM